MGQAISARMRNCTGQSRFPRPSDISDFCHNGEVEYNSNNGYASTEEALITARTLMNHSESNALEAFLWAYRDLNSKRGITKSGHIQTISSPRRACLPSAYSSLTWLSRSNDFIDKCSLITDGSSELGDCYVEMNSRNDCTHRAMSSTATLDTIGIESQYDSKPEKVQTCTTNISTNASTIPHLDESTIMNSNGMIETDNIKNKKSYSSEEICSHEMKRNATICNEIANIILHKGGLNEALDWYEKAIEYDPKSHEYWYKCGVLWQRLGYFDEAIKRFRNAIEYSQGTHTGARFNLSVVLMHVGRHAEALDGFEQMINLNNASKSNSHAEILKMMADCCERLGHYGRAITLLRQVLAIDPSYFGAKQSLARLDPPLTSDIDSKYRGIFV